MLFGLGNGIILGRHLLKGGEVLIKVRRLFQCEYPKLRRLFEDRRLLEEMQYLEFHLEKLGLS